MFKSKYKFNSIIKGGVILNQDEYMEQLKMAGEFHGEICGGIAIGTKLAMYGMELMGMDTIPADDVHLKPDLLIR